MTKFGVVSFGAIVVAIFVGSDNPTLKARLHKAIVGRQVRHGQGSTDSLNSSQRARSLENELALAIEVERERHEPYPHAWE